MENIIKKIQLPSGGIYDIYDEGAARKGDLAGLATEAYVDQKVADLVDGAPDQLNTLKELSEALNNDADIVKVLETSVTNKLDREVYNEKITEIEIAISGKADDDTVENLGYRVSDLANSTNERFDENESFITNLNLAALDIQEQVDVLKVTKVDAIPGKDLSSNDYTTAEKNKLANIAENANNYSLPAATETTLGGIKIGKNVTYEGQQLGVTSDNISSALGYVPAKNVDIDTSLSMSGAAADAKTVGDLIDSLDQVIALDENANGNVVLQSYIIADEEEGGGAAGRLDSSLTQAGVAPDSKAVGDAINLRMLASAVIPVAQGGSGKTTAVESFKVLQSRGLLTGDMNSMMNVGAGWVQLANCTNTPYGNNPTGKNGYLEVIEPESGEILQRYTNHADGMVWLRSYANNSWTAWFEGGASSTIVPASKGGTGHDFSSIPANAIIRNSGDNTQLWYTPTASGALYATAANGSVKFGTLPIAQGGTGATTAAAACTALGALPKSGGTITGSLYINNTIDGSSTANSNVGLIIGNRSGTHIIIDTNEIIAKDSGTTGGTLILGDASSIVHINSKLILRNNHIYGTSLPAAGTAGRIFFKKV